MHDDFWSATVVMQSQFPSKTSKPIDVQFIKSIKQNLHSSYVIFIDHQSIF